MQANKILETWRLWNDRSVSVLKRKLRKWEL